MADPKTLLLHLVADLIRADVNGTIPVIKDLVNAFKKDPESVMAAYGISEEARSVLFTMDRQLIGEHVYQELLRTPGPTPQDLWSDPVPLITNVKPDKLQAAPGQQLVLMADCVLSSAEVHLMSDDRLNHFVAKPTFNPIPLRLKDETLTAMFDLSGAAADDYHVLVYNAPDAAPLRAKRLIKIVADSKKADFEPGPPPR
jgi:hypothetical protein